MTGVAAPRPTEEVADVGAAGLAGGVEQIVQVELLTVASAEPTEATTATAEPAPTEPAACEQPAGFVVFLALGRIGEHLLGLRSGLVPLFGHGVARVPVGVVLGEDLAGSPLDLVLAGVGGDAELLVEVLLNPLSLGHTASPPYLLILVRGQFLRF